MAGRSSCQQPSKVIPMSDTLTPATTPKPGPQTSEFWQTLLTSILAIVVSITTLMKVDFEPTGLAAIIPAVSVLAAAFASGFYAHSRSVVKVAALTTNGHALNETRAEPLVDTLRRD
jgi:hypothetical protein